MPIKGRKMSHKSNAVSLYKEKVAPLTAVIVAEDVAHRFEPLTSAIPHCLLPLGNIPLLHFSLNRVINDGFLNVIIYAYRNADQIKQFVEENKYEQRWPNLSISVFNGLGCRCIGDVMRDLESNQLLHGVEEFVMVPADIICDVNLAVLLSEFKTHRATVNTTVLGVVLTEVPYFAPSDSERLTVVYSSSGMKLLQLIRHDRDVPIICGSDIFDSKKAQPSSIEIQSNLFEPRIYMCSNHLPPLYQDNFDYDSMDDVVHGILTNEEVMRYTIHLDFIQSGKIVLPAAQTLTHLLDITPRLLTRLGGNIIFPPQHHSTDAYSRIIEGLKHHRKTSFAPIAASPTCYVSKSAHVHPTARFIGSCIIGDNCYIGENVCLIDTCLGDDCTVESGSRLRNVVGISSVSIGSNVIADMSWICPNARILDGVRLGPKCFIGPPAVVPGSNLNEPNAKGLGVGICLGPNVILPTESVLVAPGPGDVLLSTDQGGINGWATFYQPKSRNLKIVSGDSDKVTEIEDNESDSDIESVGEAEVVLWRSNWAPKINSRSRTTSCLYSITSDDAFLTGVPSSDITRSRHKSCGDLEEESEKEDIEASDEFLIQEMQKTLQRSLYRKQPTDVVILEINSLKHAYNVSIEDLYFFLIKALLELASSQVKAKELIEAEKVKEFALSFKQLVAQFSDVLSKYLSSSKNGGQFYLQAIEDHACYHTLVLDAGQWLFHALYDHDLVSEEAIHIWVKDSPLLADEDVLETTLALRKNLAPFLKWLEEAEEDDDDDE